MSGRALFGALPIFPVYSIGKILFSKKAGLIAALLIALIPIHVSSGLGSAYALFDHDSFNLLLYFITFLFFIKSIKEKNTVCRILYALLAGVSLAALPMVWVEAQFLYTILTIYVVVQLLVDLFTNKVEERFVLSAVIALFTGFFVSWPISFAGGVFIDLPFFLALGARFLVVCVSFLNENRCPGLSLSQSSLVLVLLLQYFFILYITIQRCFQYSLP